MKVLRLVVCTGGAVILIIGLGFAFQLPFATGTWPWPDGKLSYLFIGSILAAVSAAAIWIGWTGEWGALPAGSLNILVIAIATTVYFFVLSAARHPELIRYGLVGILAIIASSTAFFWSQKKPLHDQRNTPKLVRISFGIYITALLLAGGALVLQIPIFPWNVKPESSVVFGCIFLGDAFYFFYGLLRPVWYNALGQLLSFLAYDLVLIVPFILLFKTIKPEQMLSLIIYTSVLVYSGAISIYFLFIHKETRNL